MVIAKARGGSQAGEQGGGVEVRDSSVCPLAWIFSGSDSFSGVADEVVGAIVGVAATGEVEFLGKGDDVVSRHV